MKIIKVHPNSLAEEIGLNPGDKLLKINNKHVLDHIDYRLGYIEGSGQLCAKCSYTRTFIKGIHT